MKKDCNLIIVKKNDLIENFIFNTTEFELHILNYAIAITNPRWENRNVIYRILIPDLVKIFKTKNNNRAWEQYRKALLRLMKRTYEYYDEYNNKHTENLIIRATSHEYDKTWLEFKFNDYISTRISNLSKLFTKYDIKNISKFKSKYAFLLYEFFMMKLCHNNKYVKKIKVNNLRENLNLVNKYSSFKDLKNNVLEKAKININRYSDIQMGYEIIKTGRTPTHIKFTVKCKRGKELQFINARDNLSENNKPSALSITQLEKSEEHFSKGKEGFKTYFDKINKKIQKN